MIAKAAGDWASSSYESELFIQTRNTSGGLVTALTIDEAQNLLVYATTKETRGVTIYGNGSNGLYMATTGTCMYWITNHDDMTSADDATGTYVTIYNDGTSIGSITVTNTTDVVYGGTSDYRRKDNIADMSGATARLKQLRPITFNWKENGGAAEGFLAHEVSSICPNAVSGEKDEVYTEEEAGNEPGHIKAGDPKYQTLDPAKLVPLLTKAIQELEVRVKELENK